MDLILLILRLIHILGGTLWVGFGVFVPLILAPALGGLGPEAGKVMAALQRRGLTTVLPLLALATTLSGLWLYWRVAGVSVSEFLLSRRGLSLAVGGALAVIAYALGMVITRPAFTQAHAAAQQLAAAAGPERERLQATVARLRVRGEVAGQWGAVLLLAAAACMAVARYL